MEFKSAESEARGNQKILIQSLAQKKELHEKKLHFRDRFVMMLTQRRRCPFYTSLQREA